MRYLLNSAVITAPGDYSYRLISEEEAVEWIQSNEWKSTIGYETTAEALSLMAGVHISVNRVTIKMAPGDEALVFRIVLPEGTPRIDPRDKGRLQWVLNEGHWELGLLRRIE